MRLVGREDCISVTVGSSGEALSIPTAIVPLLQKQTTKDTDCNHASLERQGTQRNKHKVDIYSGSQSLNNEHETYAHGLYENGPSCEQRWYS